MLYVPYSQEQPNCLGRMHHIVQTNRASWAFIPAIRQLMREIDPDVPVVDISTIGEKVAAN